MEDIFNLVRAKRMVDAIDALKAMITITDDDVRKIASHAQRSPEWHTARNTCCGIPGLPRLTTSNFGAAAGYNMYSSRNALLKQFLWPKPFPTSAAMQRGIDNEPKVAATYIRFRRSQGHPQLHVSYPNLLVWQKHPWMAGSPDGFVHVSGVESPPSGALEIKFPSVNTGLYPVTPLMYLCQITGVMAMNELPWTDFVVGSESKTQIRRIAFHREFWDDDLFPKLQSWYFDAFLPRWLLKQVGALHVNEINPVMKIEYVDCINPDHDAADNNANDEMSASMRTQCSADFDFFIPVNVKNRSAVPPSVIEIHIT